MAQGDKGSAAKAMTKEDNGEIDKIMQEIEDLEKKMDDTSTSDAAESQAEEATDNVVSLRDDTDIPDAEEPVAKGPLDEVDTEDLTDDEGDSDDNGATTTTTAVTKRPAVKGDSGLSLSVGGVSNVTLEFARHGMSVTMTCTDEGLVITTDQGAEFRVPFKRAA